MVLDGLFADRLDDDPVEAVLLRPGRRQLLALCGQELLTLGVQIEDLGLDRPSLFRRLVHLRLSGRLVEGLKAGGEVFVLQVIELALAVLDRIDEVPGVILVKGASLRDRPTDQGRR